MNKGKRNRYSPEDQAAAVEMYLASPKSETLRSVAHALTISQSSLHNWVQEYRAAHPEDER